MDDVDVRQRNDTKGSPLEATQQQGDILIEQSTERQSTVLYSHASSKLNLQDKISFGSAHMHVHKDHRTLDRSEEYQGRCLSKCASRDTSQGDVDIDHLDPSRHIVYYSHVECDTRENTISGNFSEDGSQGTETDEMKRTHQTLNRTLGTHRATHIYEPSSDIYGSTQNSREEPIFLDKPFLEVLGIKSSLNTEGNHQARCPSSNKSRALPTKNHGFSKESHAKEELDESTHLVYYPA